MRWGVPPADKVEILRKHDTFHKIRSTLAEVAERHGEWAGIPTPIDGTHLHVHPSYPYAHVFNGTREAEEVKAEDVEKYGAYTIRNRWWSSRIRGECYIWQDGEGKIAGGGRPAGHHFDYDWNTMAASYAWGIEQEHNALKLLGTMVRHHLFKAYILTGMLVESSPRSGLSYIFRRLRPTVALSPREKPGRERDSMRILCCLCMHPIGYYENSWAGALCPTDDVIAHLSLMRADEHLYWKRCNQIPPWMPNAGL